MAVGRSVTSVFSDADRRRLMDAALVLLTAGVLLGVCFRALAPFFATLVCAAIMAVAAWPLAGRLAVVLGGRRRLAATLIGAGYFLLLALPMIFLSLTLRNVFRDAWLLAADVSAHGLPPPPAFLGEVPVFGPRLVRLWEQDVHNLAVLASTVESVLLDGVALVFRQLTDLLSALGEIVFGIVLTTELLTIGQPVPDLLQRFAVAVGGHAANAALAATRKAILEVALWLIGCALVEAGMSGLGFWLAGMPLPLELAFLCFVLRVLQIGPWPVWVPALAWLWWQPPAGSWAADRGAALFLAAWLVVAVMGTGRLLRPLLIAQRPDVPTPLLFLAVLGGLMAWGFSGMFLGAAALALIASLAQNWLRTVQQPTDLGMPTGTV